MERSIAVWRPEIANSNAEATLCENTFYYIQILSKLHWNKWKWQKNMNLCSILFTFEKYMYFFLVKWSHRLCKKDKRKQSMSLHKISELKNGRQRNDNLIVFVDTLMYSFDCKYVNDSHVSSSLFLLSRGAAVVARA